MTYAKTLAPKSSPWGVVQDATELAAGVWLVSTASHGGVKLSPERNAAMPTAVRHADGWYEEDCDWSLAALVHPDAFTAKALTSAHDTARHWLPDEYTAITGEALTPSTSRALSERQFRAMTETAFVVASGFGSWSPFVPEGKVGVCAFRASDGAEQWALVDAAKYKAYPPYVLDPEHDEFIPRPERTHD